jgi:hypothetical protein
MHRCFSAIADRLPSATHALRPCDFADKALTLAID